MQKFVQMSYLIDCYGELLTEKQLEMLRMYYEDDLSLGEIGEINAISRQAAFDAIKKGEATLNKYEEKLGLLEKQAKTEEMITSIKSLLQNVAQGAGSKTDFEKIEALLDNISES